MPEAGNYLLAHVGFSSKEKPLLVLQKSGEFIDFEPLGHTLTLTFDMSQRHCVGWHDIATGESFACPDNTSVEHKFDQCAACQNRTGFNPAFYHAASVSAQQEERNAKPHFLYLAHFAPGLMKVGISFAGRGRSRLLEQGARSAVILETFPSAHIARQYEAKIAKLPGIAETIQLRKKIATLSKPYDTEKAASELRQALQAVEAELGTKFNSTEVLTFGSAYFPNASPDLSHAHDVTNDHAVTGKAVGMIGSLLFCIHQDTPLFLPMKKHTGYKVSLRFDETSINLPAQQISLF